MKNYIYLLTALLFLGVSACNDVEYDSVPAVDKIKDLNYSVVERNITLTWTLPETAGVAGVLIQCNNDPKIEVPGQENSYTFERVPLNRELAYTVKVKYENGRISEGETVRALIEGELSGKFGSLIAYNSIEEIEDDDEIAAVQWFTATYSTGEIITPEMAKTIDLNEFTAIWIHIDRMGINEGYENLPAAIVKDEGVMTTLKNYYADGGESFTLCSCYTTSRSIGTSE